VSEHPPSGQQAAGLLERRPRSGRIAGPVADPHAVHAPNGRARRNGSHHRPPRRSIRVERAIVFLVALAAPVYLALRGDGYDIVVRQEFGIVLWWSLSLAFAFGILPRARLRPAARLPLVGLAGLIVWTGLSLIWTQSQERTFEELARTVNLAGVVVLVWTGLSARTWKSAAAGLSVAALAIPAVAVASRLDPGAFPVGVLSSLDRLSYPLGYWNAVGAWSAMAIAVGLALSAHLRRPAFRAVALAAVPVAGTAIYLTYSRSGVIGAVIAVIAVIALAGNRWTAAIHALAAGVATGAVVLVVRSQDEIAHATGSAGGGLVALALLVACAVCAAIAEVSRRRGLDLVRLPTRWGRAAALACASLAVIGGIAFGPRVVAHAGDEFSSGSYPATRGDPATRLVSLEGSRYQVWSSALGAFSSKPLTGIGPGTFEFWWDRDVPGGEPLRDAHSLYLETLAELGLPGFALLAALIAGLLLAASQARRRARGRSGVAATTALTAAFVVYLFHAGVDWMWESTGITVLALAAVCVAASSTQAIQPRGRRLSRARVAIVALAVLAGAIQIPGLVSTGRVRASATALADGHVGAARGLASQALAAEPWAATPYAERALAEFGEGRLAAARKDTREAIAREPTNWRHRMLLARIEIEAGNRRGVLRAAHQLSRLRPGMKVKRSAIIRAVPGRPGHGG
jgi:O-Antigen ligase